MKKDQKQQMRSQDKEGLIKRLSEIAKQLVDLKMDFVMGKLKNVHSMKQLKKERAYINTILAEK
ncbi:50S ribosomal protein L29 [Candidatus Beckwithbacteria bacterium CG23_combo_of_CG06-09_8_20_14_all_34_8]|uniref:Large ribosomal subunit protein uL29 n=1 Tax=Candidatus Beckwithbacteria bacterium CG23_combo_of_CG06-09_8_20_14_all_34_8 TaxID=1974497 RepID=A0A2H0B6S6_9BACT|nr:MAG: 50S ribosomal protein L29 [Candidatus Beckwithbacteria bacterium CG23_combo_of_CG06-09_8_20_14_all_34_8]